MLHKKNETYARYIQSLWKNVRDKDNKISKTSVMLINSLLLELFRKIAQESIKILEHSKIATMTARTIETATRLVMKDNALAKAVILNGTRAVKTGTSDFPVGRIHRYLKETRVATRVSRKAALCLAGVLQRVAEELMDMGSMFMGQKKTLSFQHLSMAVRGDESLDALFGTDKTIFGRGGVNVRQST